MCISQETEEKIKEPRDMNQDKRENAKLDNGIPKMLKIRK